jgi:DNA-binding NtrC family response regulator
VTRRAQVDAEKQKIQLSLREAGGDKGRAADLLGVPYKQLLVKLKEHGFE